MVSIKNVTVVIRSVNERTEELCKKLILNQGVTEENVFIIHERPFSRAMRVGYQLGIDRELPWTYCVDADVLLKDGAIREMIRIIEKMHDNTLGISGELLDKLSGERRSAGNHLFRTMHLFRLIENIKSFKDETIRPESSAIKKMHDQGYSFKKNVLFIGLHDFEQHYHDIARKAFTHSKKHKKHICEFVSFWTKKAYVDNDFKAALFGLSKGLLHLDDVKINVDDFMQLSKETTDKFGIKSETVSDFSIQSIKDVYDAMNNQNNYFITDAELEDKYEKIFRKKINERSYKNVIKLILVKVLHDIKNRFCL